MQSALLSLSFLHVVLLLLLLGLGVLHAQHGSLRGTYMLRIHFQSF